MLLKFVADVDRSLPVLFLDTLWLFKETPAYRDALAAHLGLTDVRTITPSPSELAQRDPKRDLCFHDRDACCDLRKVAPLARELAAFDGWISGRKRYHGGERIRRWRSSRPRRSSPEVQSAGAAHRRTELDADVRGGASAAPSARGLGFTSIGCVPCTARAAAGTSVRDGRWSGLAKTECGIHSRRLTASNSAR